MSHHQSLPAGEQTYRVEVGHCAMEVQSTSVDAAIASARYRFMRELPRLWDVIQQLDPARFKVTML